jgi:anti-anti-sigma factor
MPATPVRPRFEWDNEGDVTIVRFTVRSIRTDDVIHGIFDDIARLLADGRRTQLVLDFGAVQDFASLTVSKLLALNKQLHPPAGRLALCQLTPVVAELFEIMSLGRIFHIYPTQEEALRSF